MYFTLYLRRGIFIYTTMNRDIITADIEWGLDGEYNASPILNLKVEIDDADFSRNVYIEDIKLYNQNTFVNPTNASGGISIINVPVVEGVPMIDNKKKINGNIDLLFVEDDTPTYTTGHYKKDNGDYVAVGVSEEPSTTYSFVNEDKYYYNSSTVEGIYNYVEITYADRKKEYFYEVTDKIKIYDYENLQNDPLFTQNFDISNDIIIISVKVHPNPDDKCQSDYILRAVYNKRLLLLESMSGVREIADTCTIPRRFIDFILRQKAIDLAQENNDIDLLCKYFKMFSGSIGTNKIEFAPCGCLRG